LRFLAGLGAAFLIMIFHAGLIFSGAPPPLWLVSQDQALIIAAFEIFVSILIGGYLLLKLVVILHDRPRSPRDRFWDEGLVD